MNLDEQVAAFLRERGVRACIAVSGGAGTEDDNEFLEGFLGYFEDAPVAVVTSGTRNGTPHATLVAAARHRVPVIRVYPERAVTHGHLADAPPGALDIPVAPRIGASAWGDESEVFVKLASGLVVIGGAAGTLVELAHWAKENQSRADHEEALVPAALIMGARGISELFIQEGYAQFPKFWNGCTNTFFISDGAKAAAWLAEHLGF